jgi:uncharacterized protein
MTANTNSFKIETADKAVVLREIVNFMRDIQGLLSIVVATADGFKIASISKQQSDTAHSAALASSMAAISQVASDESHLGVCKSVTIEAANGFIAIYSAKLKGADIAMIVTASTEAITAQLHYRANSVLQHFSTL